MRKSIDTAFFPRDFLVRQFSGYHGQFVSPGHSLHHPCPRARRQAPHKCIFFSITGLTRSLPTALDWHEHLDCTHGCKRLSTAGHECQLAANNAFSISATKSHQLAFADLHKVDFASNTHEAKPVWLTATQCLCLCNYTK